MHLIKNMGLYPVWQNILQQHADSVAIYCGNGSRLSFADLQKQLDQQPALKARQIHAVSAEDGVVEFIIQTLRAWRDDAVLCPIETRSSIPPLPDPAAIPLEITHLKFTSGSTGTPRCIMFRAEQLAADPENIRSTMGLNPDYPNLAVISIAHSYGFSNLALPLLLQGHPLVQVSDVLPASLHRAVALFQNANARFTLPAVPAMWRAWFRAGALQQLPVALAITAGAPMPLELEQSIFQQHRLKIHNFLGSSECGAIAYDRTEEPRTDSSYVGSAADNVLLEVHSDGCLLVKGGNVAEGYLNATEEDSARLGNGQFLTSDLADICASGQIHLLGRASDTINLAGRKLDPAELETLLLQHPEVHHCVVFGVPSRDASRCEETVACINVDPNLCQSDLVHWISDKLPSWKRPRHYWFNDQLRPDIRGKTPRPQWRNLWLQQHSNP